MSRLMTQDEIAERAPDKDKLWLYNGARGAAYRYALERGWITQEEHDEARRRYGRLWNYTGD